MNRLDFSCDSLYSYFEMTEKEPDGIAVEIDNVSFRYYNIKALDELSLQVPVGIS